MFDEALGETLDAMSEDELSQAVRDSEPVSTKEHRDETRDQPTSTIDDHPDDQASPMTPELIITDDEKPDDHVGEC